jgi:hypothetical protein
VVARRRPRRALSASARVTAVAEDAQGRKTSLVLCLRFDVVEGGAEGGSENLPP